MPDATMNPEELKEFLEKCMQILRIEQKIKERRNKIYYKQKLFGRERFKQIDEILNQTTALQSCIDREKEVITILERNRSKIEFALSVALAEITEAKKTRNKEIEKALQQKPKRVQSFLEEVAAQIESMYEELLPQRKQRISCEEEFLKNQERETLEQIEQMLKKEENELKKIQKRILSIEERTRLILNTGNLAGVVMIIGPWWVNIVRDWQIVTENVAHNIKADPTTTLFSLALLFGSTIYGISRSTKIAEAQKKLHPGPFGKAPF